MTEKEAQDIAFKWANLNSLNITLAEIKQALVVLGNFYEDTKYLVGSNLAIRDAAVKNPACLPITTFIFIPFSDRLSKL